MLAIHGPDAAGIAYRLPVTAPARAFLHLLRLSGGAAWWAAQRHQGLSDHAYPSMVSDPMHGRLTEVDALNGEVVRVAACTGGNASCNAAIRDLLHALERQRDGAALSPEALAVRLARQTAARNRP